MKEDTQSWLLPARLLDSAGIGNEPYFIVTAALRDALNIGDEKITPKQAKAFNALAQLQLRGEFERLLMERLGVSFPER